MLNILLVAGVLNVYGGKQYQYNPKVLEGNEAAEVQNQELKIRQCETEVANLRKTIQDKEKKASLIHKQLIALKRLRKRNEKFQGKLNR